MRNNVKEYPHPVLSLNTKDYINSSFKVKLMGQSDDEEWLQLELTCELLCDGIEKMLSQGLAQVVVRVECPRTSYRDLLAATDFPNISIKIPKAKVSDVVSIQTMIVAKGDCEQYYLDEFNQNYFGNHVFKLKKGDIIASEQGMWLKLNTVLEKNVPSIVLVSTAKDVKELRIKFAKTDEENEKYRDYITVWLPESEFLLYEKLRKRKMFKASMARFLQASVILPAITEGIAKIRMEESIEPEPGEATYKGTIWADSICEALKNIGIEGLIDNTDSDYELANKLLGNVTGDSLDNLMRKMKDWSTLRQEDEIL